MGNQLDLKMAVYSSGVRGYVVGIGVTPDFLHRLVFY